MPNWTLKSRMAGGDSTIGSWLNLSSPFFTEMMAKAGFDWLVVDMEHGTSGQTELIDLIQVIDLAGLPALVRVGDNNPYLIKRAMDAGACGVIVPMVKTVEDILAARDALYYPPKGSRGVGLTRAHDFGLGFDEYKEQAAQNSILIAQIEHVDAIENLTSILDVDEVDGFIVGPYDLSGSIGKPGRFDDPEVVAQLDRATEIIKHHKKPGGYHIVHSDHALLKQRLDEGCRFVAYGTEMIFMAEKLRDESAFIQSLKK